MVGAAIGLVYVLRADRRRAVLPLALIVLGSVSFFAIGLSGLPTLSRFFFLPALVLALFCAVVVGGWRPEGVTGPRRPVELAVWGVLVLGALASLPLEASKLNNADHYARTAQHFEVDLHTLVRNPVARGWIRRCPTVGFHTNRVRPIS